MLRCISPAPLCYLQVMLKRWNQAWLQAETNKQTLLIHYIIPHVKKVISSSLPYAHA